MSLELRRCPFCGGEAEIIEVKEWEQVYYAECDDCHIRTVLKYDREEAIADWNARVETPIAESTVHSVFMDLITDEMDGKYKGYTPSAMIQECHDKILDAIRYQKGEE